MGRITTITTSKDNDSKKFDTKYTYMDVYGTNAATNLVDSLTQNLGSTELVKYYYSYDENNNITEIDEDNNSIVEYEYDGLNQLHREIDKVNRTIDYTFYRTYTLKYPIGGK